jgi:dTDP-4-dehydrorhamnose 3,5-epimerase
MIDVRRVGITGVMQVALRPIADERGSFLEAFRREWIPGSREMLQANLSRSTARVLRGVHFHRRQADYWVLVEGRAHVGLHDLRVGSPTQGVGLRVAMSADEPSGLYIPPGVAHGFYAETDIALQYLVDEYFDGSDEHGIAWDDPNLGIDWPSAKPILSTRDRANPALSEALSDPPRFR